MRDTYSKAQDSKAVKVRPGPNLPDKLPIHHLGNYSNAQHYSYGHIEPGPNSGDAVQG